MLRMTLLTTLLTTAGARLVVLRSLRCAITTTQLVYVILRSRRKSRTS